MALDPLYLARTLLDAGITVHHVAPGALGTLVVYLEGNRGQWEQAQDIAQGLSDVRSVSFSDATNAIMFVHT